MNIKTLRREHILLLFSFLSLSIIYGFWYYMNARQGILLSNICIAKKELQEKNLHFRTLKQTVENVQSILHNDNHKKITRQFLGDLLKKIARKHHFFHLYFTFMPEKSAYQDSSFIMKKSLIKLKFSTCSDCDVWNFLKELYQEFPGIIQSKDFSLEKAEVNEVDADFLGINSLLKGTYIFEWYTIYSLTEKNIFCYIFVFQEFYAIFFLYHLYFLPLNRQKK
jgi:hypothetical protein